jgi:hypothetical protein
MRLSISRNSEAESGEQRTERKRVDHVIILKMVDLKYNRKKLPLNRLIIYLIILIALIIFIVRIREIFSFLEVYNKLR